MGSRMTVVATKLPAPELRKLRALAAAGGMTSSGFLREMVRSATGFELAPVKVFFQNEDGSGGNFTTASPAAARQA